jgi:light-regulated signal transduction histidine kinase (bacteriophytochrome)
LVLSSQIKTNNITIKNLVSSEVEIKYNSAYLENIPYNIISNAIRFSHKERNSIITIKYYKENDLKVLEIADNGIGINFEKNKDKVLVCIKLLLIVKTQEGLV